MRIQLDINEDSTVEITRCDECEAMQGESGIVVFECTFPDTINGVSINNFIKNIVFKEICPCKNGSCVQDTLANDNTYTIKSNVSQFKNVQIQLVLSCNVNNMCWKTLPIEYSFGDSINATVSIGDLQI